MFMLLTSLSLRYILATLISLTALGLQNLFWEHLNPMIWILLYPAVFFASFVGGLGPGLFATFFCAASAYHLFWSNEPGFQLTGQGVFQVVVFIVSGGMYSVFNNHLRKTREQLAHSLAVRDEFLSIASHELKTPITTLVLQMEISRMRIQQQASHLWPTLEKYFAKSKDQADKLVTLIDELLNVTRISSGRLVLNKERFDLNFLTQEVVERFAEPYRLSGIALEFERPDKAAWIEADRGKIGQVLTNLLSNAQKYGNGRPVAVRLTTSEERARVEVIDHGMGIAKDKQDKIFERFERAVSSRQISGLGLGLYISSSIVRDHGGTISVESELGQGSIFSFELPLAN